MADLFDSFLDEAEREAVKRFYADELTREAVRKVLLAGVYQNGTLKKGKKADPLMNFALGYVSKEDLTYEEIGKYLTASWEGIKRIEQAFSNMAKYQDYPDLKVGLNPAR